MSQFRTIWTEQQLRDAVSSSVNLSEVIEKLGYTATANYTTIVKYCSRLGISIEHLQKGAQRVHKRHSEVKTDEEMFKVSEFVADVKHCKKRIIRKGLLPYMCAICGMLPEWQGKPLNLALDHISGDRRDNRLENLRFLCSNCHSQTETYCGKNAKTRRQNKSSFYPSVEEFTQLLPKYGSLTAVAKELQLDYKLLKEHLLRNGMKEEQLVLKGVYRPRLNIRKIVYPEVQECIQLIKDNGSVWSAAGTLGVTDNALRKYLQRHGVDTKSLAHGGS